jgi:iron-sulfur cluster repair protein YtfE (RIC family)
MQPLLDEHQHLRPHIEALAAAGDAVGAVALTSLRATVDDSLAFLLHHLIPHATAEEQVLYPAVARLLGDPRATATMTRDHVEIDRLVQELSALRTRLCTVDELDADLTGALRRVLYGLAAIVRLHLAKEEEVYVPVLEAGLTAGAADRLFEEMDTAAFHAQAASAGRATV